MLHRWYFALFSSPPWSQHRQTLPAAPPAASAAEDGQWMMPAMDYASTRFSGLDEINDSNVRSLQVAFTFSTGVNRGQEASPLMVGTTLYVLTPHPNILYALDLTKSGAPMKWRYDPKPEPAAQGVACCDVVTRGPVYAEARSSIPTVMAGLLAANLDLSSPVGNRDPRKRLGTTVDLRSSHQIFAASVFAAAGGPCGPPARHAHHRPDDRERPSQSLAEAQGRAARSQGGAHRPRGDEPRRARHHRRVCLRVPRCCRGPDHGPGEPSTRSLSPHAASAERR
ncbi:MAG: PQQ-dependent dehydrogenase, methanol/ethanol family [Xanthobacteraceae bacterium]|jgi:hypothetical protein|nr:PQQ-dependent dehydrogenase, methanol/ethanol family [Xanthobacteraceae bacterium]